MNWTLLLLAAGWTCVYGFVAPTTTPRATSRLAAAKKPATHFDMDELRKRIAATTLWYHPPADHLPDDFYILLIQPGTPQQGVHTIESRSGSNLILAFADETACQAFADQLRAQRFVDPTVSS